MIILAYCRQIIQNDLLRSLVAIILCHLVGDYLFQSDYLAANKGKDWYILFVHCALYSLPFLIIFGLTYRIGILFATHIVIDVLKARYNKIDILTDQLLHYVIAFVLFVLIN